MGFDFATGKYVFYVGASGAVFAICVAFAAGTAFKERIAHGILTASLLSTVFGTKMPGPGCKSSTSPILPIRNCWVRSTAREPYGMYMPGTVSPMPELTTDWK